VPRDRDSTSRFSEAAACRQTPAPLGRKVEPTPNPSLPPSLLSARQQAKLVEAEGRRVAQWFQHLSAEPVLKVLMTDSTDNALNSGNSSSRADDTKSPQSRRGKQYKCGMCHQLGHNRCALALVLFSAVTELRGFHSTSVPSHCEGASVLAEDFFDFRSPPIAQPF
jgi:hypothetical protein